MLTSSKLNRLLSSPKNVAELKSAIQHALPAFRRGLAERGRSAPLEFSDAGSSISIDRRQLQNLCGWYLSGKIDEAELEYVAGLLDLSEDFHCADDVRDAISILSSPEISGGISPKSVKNILNRWVGAT